MFSLLVIATLRPAYLISSPPAPSESCNVLRTAERTYTSCDSLQETRVRMPICRCGDSTDKLVPTMMGLQTDDMHDGWR